MARFNLDDYEMVQDRLARCRKDNPGLIVETKILEGFTCGDPGSTRWVVEATLYRSREDYANVSPGGEHFPIVWSTGLAFEIDGSGGLANSTSALENCETSAVGRALANAGYHGDRRASREEMVKVKKMEDTVSRLVKMVGKAGSLDELKALWGEASKRGLANNDRLVQEFKARSAVING